MYERILTLIAACFYYSGLVKLADWWKQRAGEPTLVILNYHRAGGGNLRRHLLYLRRHYRVLHLEAALEELYTSDKRGGDRKGRDRRIPLVITLDDGYYDNYSVGLKLASELRVPMTVFLIPGYIESGRRFWWLEPEQLVANARVGEVTLEEHTYHLNNADERKALVQVIDAHVRHATTVAEREAFLVFIREVLAETALATVVEKPVLPLTWAEVREMDESGWISFGAHTMHHPILAYLADPAEVQFEVSECKAVLEQRLGHPVRALAYPVGWLDHIGLQGVRATHEAGYCWAVTTVYGFNTAESDPYLLRRIEADVDEPWLLLAAKASGVWFFFTGLFRTLLLWKRTFFRRKHRI